MKSLIDEAKEIIEMSLSAQMDNEAFSLKANDWLKKAKAHEISEASDAYDTETSCALCGNDLVCPSCHDH
jgi:hypothetical protein